VQGRTRVTKGEKGKAWRRCIGEYVKAELAKYEHTV
jgi:hypothetical protein